MFLRARRGPRAGHEDDDAVKLDILRMFQSWINLLFALVIRNQASWPEDAMRRARVVAGMCVSLFFFDLLVILPAAYATDARAASTSPVLVAIICCYLLDLLLLRHSRSPRLVAVLAIAQILLSMNIVAFETGQVQTTMMWGAMLTVMGMFLLGGAGGTAVTVACIANSIMLSIAELAGYLPRPPRPILGSGWMDDLVLTTSLIALAGLMAWAYEAARQRDLQARDLARAGLVQAMEAAQAANRAKSQFLANMSHEIRTPMNGVLGMLGMLLDGELGDAEREYAATAQSSARSLLDVINDILDLSRVEAGRLALEPVPFDLRAVIKDVVDQAAVQARGKDVEILVRYLPEVPSRFVGDEGRIRQILVNLVGNAVKFTSRGHVAVAVAVAVAQGGERDGAVLLDLSVEDTGVGIPAAAQQIIFEKFQQADGSTTRLYGGSGLGLAIVRELVTLMGGRVGVASEVGKGSRFWITLPLARDRSVPAPAQPEAAPREARVLVVDDHPANREVPEAPRPRRVLVVEDNVINQKVAMHLLADLGWRVDVAANGHEALRLIREIPYELVFMDVQMPEMDGLQATAAIRAGEAGPGRRLPIVAMTAHAMQGDLERCLAAGMDGYVSKPVNKRDLAQVLARFAPG
jgi:signal transduction histidine kinase/CheY-like chemotaxis protein